MYQGGNQSFASPAEALEHISEQAWSNWSKADYTIEQWHSACLVHTHDGEPTSKAQCKLPVKTPDGALNRNGVHAAAAALAGARGGLKGVSADQKTKAANALKRYYSQLDEEPPESLSHHGVKGQKWGVRKEEDLVGQGSGPKSPPKDASGKIMSDSAKAAEYHRLAEGIAKRQGIDSNLAAAKYAPPGMRGQIEKQQKADNEKLKKIALGVGIGLGAAAVGIAVYKLNQSPGGFPAMPTGKDKVKALIKTNDKAYTNTVDGLHINWNHGVELPKGSIVRRLSTVAETAPRPEGFYAAHLDADVNSYKAILPTFWARWGMGSPEKGGFLNHYKANQAIRAPSGKDSFELFKHLIDTDDTFNAHFNNFWDPNGARGYTETRLKQLFVDTSANWAEPTNEFTQHWVKEVQKRGYNALIDFNDAGKLGKTPLRIIDGTMFDIVKNEPQSLDDFYTAAKQWSPELIHVFTVVNGERVLIHIDDFLRTVKLGQDILAVDKIDLDRVLLG